MRFARPIRSARHKEEAFKLDAVALNSVAIACIIGGSVGPWLNPSLEWGWRSLVLIVAGVMFHVLAQIVLYFGFDAERQR